MIICMNEKKPPMRRIPLCITLPDRLYFAVTRQAKDRNNNISVEIGRMLCFALGMDDSIVLNGARKRADKDEQLIDLQRDQLKMPFPKTLYELQKHPYRSQAAYIGLYFAPRWGVHGPGIDCPAGCPDMFDNVNHPLKTPADLEEIARLRDSYCVYGVKD